jgi:proteasome lid subunit RPN8/RPN11
MTLVIPNNIQEELLAHSLREKPLEACGILAGVIDNGLYRVAAYYPMNNTDKSAISFFMEPQEQISVFKDIRGKGRELVGVFHSHPHSQAYPSAKDVSMAYYPEALYVILSLEKEEHPHMRAFSIVEGEIKEAEVKYSEKK